MLRSFQRDPLEVLTCFTPKPSPKKYMFAGIPLFTYFCLDSPPWACEAFPISLVSPRRSYSLFCRPQPCTSLPASLTCYLPSSNVTNQHLRHYTTTHTCLPLHRTWLHTPFHLPAHMLFYLSSFLPPSSTSYLLAHPTCLPTSYKPTWPSFSIPRLRAAYL